MLCAFFVFADDFSHTASARQAQTPAQPTPTPHVRPRTVLPKDDLQRPAAQPQSTPLPQATPTATTTAQPQPTRPDNTSPQTPGGTTPTQAGEEVDEDEVVRVDSNLVIIPASVVDARGHAVVDLKVEDFELRVDGEVKTIGDLSRSETPVHVALLFDNSASLSAAREFEKQAAVRFFRSVVRPIDRAAVYSISTTPTLSQGLTNDVPRLVRTIERFGNPDGATALFDTVAQAAEYMRPLTGRKVLVLVSDGTDTVSDTSFDDAVNRALRAECQVYVVQTRQVEDPNLHDPVSEQRMFKLTEQTGGAVYVPQTVAELDAVFTQISLDLSQQYLLSYYPQDERKDKYFRFISLRVKSRPALRVRARKGFYPAQAAQAGAGASGERSQFSGTLTNTASAPEYVNAAQTSQPGDSASSLFRRANEASAPSNASRQVAASSERVKSGPDGPDTEDRAKPNAGANEPTPTFTLRTSPSDAAKTNSPTSEALSAATIPVSTTTTLRPIATPTSSAATPSSSTNTPKTDAASPTKVSTVERTDKRDEKASPVQQSPSAPQQDTQQAGNEAPKAPLPGGVLNGKALSLPRPTYPAAARESGASGKVVVEVTIDEQGKIIEARAVSGHPFLQKAAVAAALQARFSPATLSGSPVKVKGIINYVFTLP
ncbi:MAG: Ca-activated chloride channel [Acidobacteriota bacterium]|jgi:Ca-activated chloride channel family protein|nr:Ca-activated chloride channel [Acidobacteriota bacterium]